MKFNRITATLAIVLLMTPDATGQTDRRWQEVSGEFVTAGNVRPRFILKYAMDCTIGVGCVYGQGTQSAELTISTPLGFLGWPLALAPDLEAKVTALSAHFEVKIAELEKRLELRQREQDKAVQDLAIAILKRIDQVPYDLVRDRRAYDLLRARLVADVLAELAATAN